MRRWRTRITCMKPLSLALSIEWDDCTVALTGTGVADAWLSASRSSGNDSGAQASRDALALIRRLLDDAGRPLAAIEQFFFNAGPGAFTSLRIAAGLVQGLALPRQRPVGAIASLPALATTVPAWQALPMVSEGSSPGEDALPWLLCAALDARMGECYHGAYLCRPGRWPAQVMAPAVGPAEQAAQAFRTLHARLQAQGECQGLELAGGGFAPAFEALHALALDQGHDPAEVSARRPDARAILAVAQAVGAPLPGPARDALPLYVRDRVALDRTEQRQAAALRETIRQQEARPPARNGTRP